MTNIAKELKTNLSIKNLAQGFMEVIEAAGLEGSAEDRFDSRDYFWNNLDSLSDRAYDQIHELFVGELGWTEKELDNRFEEIEEELGELVFDIIPFDDIECEVKSTLDEWEEESRDPYGSRGVSQKDFY